MVARVVVHSDVAGDTCGGVADSGGVAGIRRRGENGCGACNRPFCFNFQEIKSEQHGWNTF